MMSKNKLLLVIAVIIVAIGCLVADNLTAAKVADIRYGEWVQITDSDGTILYSPWTADMSAAEMTTQQKGEDNGMQLEHVKGYGVQISIIHKMIRKRTDGRLHLFDTQDAATRFARESGIPDNRINMLPRREDATP